MQAIIRKEDIVDGDNILWHKDLDYIKDYVVEQSDIRPKDNVFTGENLFTGKVTFSEAPSSEQVPTLPEHLVRLGDMGVILDNTLVYANNSDINNLNWI